LQSNAIKFSRKNGEVHIVCKYLQQQAPKLLNQSVQSYENLSKEEIIVKINEKTNNPKLIVSVQDNGVGIDMESQNRLFKMFGTLNDSSQMNTSGVGLGLFICKSLVEQFNGMISVNSVKDQSTTFTFCFELYSEFEPQDITESDFDDIGNIG
jgi:signal transduction histidine kinase